MKLPSEPILFCPISLTHTSCWNDDFPGGLDHSMSLLLECYIFLKVSHVTFHSESRVLMKEKRAGGRKERQRRRGSHTSLAGVAIWDDEGWRPDYGLSRTPLGLTRSQSLLPSSLKAFHLFIFQKVTKLSTPATAVAGSRPPLPSATELLSS